MPCAPLSSAPRDPSARSIERRTLLKAAAGLIVAPAFLRGARAEDGSSLFALGVASGDPDESSVVLWTRLVEDPLAGGGLTDPYIPVMWEVAADPGMRRVLRRGVAQARLTNGHAIRVVVNGLPPGRWLYYRFAAQGKYRGHDSRIGRTRTFPSVDPHRDWPYGAKDRGGYGRYEGPGSYGSGYGNYGTGDGNYGGYGNHGGYGGRGGHGNYGELARQQQMRFAVVSCQNYAQGYYAAWRDIAAQDLDFVVHTGDYIYESGASSSPLLPDRNHTGGEIFSVDDYRNRFALYRLDADLQDAHARFPFIVTWDDHEVDNNYAGLTAEESAPYRGDAFAERRRNAYRVYRESMPIRVFDAGNGDSLEIFRRLQFGDLADLHVLDTRQYRSDQPAGDGFGSTDTQVDPATAAFLEAVFQEPLFDAGGILARGATLLGARQEAWLAANLARSRAKWNVLAQQVMMMPWNLRRTGQLFVQVGPDFDGKEQAIAAIGNLQNILNVDAWDGYSKARERLIGMLARLQPPSPVVLTGDIHAAWAANLYEDFGDPQNSNVAAVEVVCTSIASTFLDADPRPTHAIVAAGLADNPHIAYFNGMFRGYSLCEVDEREWRTTFRAVGAPEDLADPNPLALVPLANDPTFTDAVATIPRGFNRPRQRATLDVQGVITGAS